MSIAFVRLANGQIVSGPAVMDFGPPPQGTAPAPPTASSVRFNILQNTGLSGGFIDFGPDPQSPFSGSLRFNLLQNTGFSGGFIDFGYNYGSPIPPPTSATMRFNLMQAVGVSGGFIDFGYNYRSAGSAPTGVPATGSGDEQRRKWLEWREQRYRQQQNKRKRVSPERVLETSPIPEPVQREALRLGEDVTATIDLFLARMKEGREREAARLRNEAIVRDDEDVLVILLGML